MDPTKHKVPTEWHGFRIDVVLAQLLPTYSRAQLSSWIKQGFITLNSKKVKPKDKVLAQDTIAIEVDLTLQIKSLETYVGEDIPLDIIYEDEQLLVINKPAGMVVHPAAGNYEHTLVQALLYYDPKLQQLPRAGLVHRLDKDTTGLLLIAKTLESHTYLIRAMQERKIQRFYITLVKGAVISGGTISTLYGRHPTNRLKMAVCKQGKEAVTHYTIIKKYDFSTLLKVKLETGRTHQIRVHMAHMNHPVIGDQLYGKKMQFPANLDSTLLQLFQNFKRQALHAANLSFMHPTTQKLLTFEAPLPHDFQTILKALDALN
jgi:23S rRNA pseudouridine1911/1915/1917 synthase